MSKQTNLFTSHELTENEILQGSIFNDLQRKMLQNHLAEAAIAKLSIEYDPENPVSFAQQEAAKKAEIELLTYLLEGSIAALEALNSTATQQE